MPEWEPPKWRQQGRSGPNGPRYKKASDRRAVSGGGSAGDGCAVTAIALAGSALVIISSAAYLAAQIGRALI